MKAFAVALAAALLTTTLTAAPSNKRQELSNQGRQRLTRIASTMTLLTWNSRIDGFLGVVTNGKTLGAKWNAKEPHWDKAHTVLMAKIMNAYDQLSVAQRMRDRMDIPFQSPLTEPEAAEVLALSAADRKELDDWTDAVGLGVFMADGRKDLKIGTPEWKEELKRIGAMAGVPTEMKTPPKANISAGAMDHYRQARTSSAEWLRSIVDGSLQLYFNDDFDSFMKVANDAALAAAK